MKQANILDPIHPDLDQRVFQYKQPKDSVVTFIKRLYYRALQQKFGIDPSEALDYVHLVLTGSLTTYQYSDDSDTDVSVFPNYPLFKQNFGLDAEDLRRSLIELTIDHLDGALIPGSPHPMQFYVVPSEVTAHDLYKPGLRSAFDLDKKQWIEPPEAVRAKDVQKDFPDVWESTMHEAEKLGILLDNHDTERAIEMWKLLHVKRRNDQMAGLGDYSQSNITYKYLFNSGLVDRLRNELGLHIEGSVKLSVPPADQVMHYLQDFRNTPNPSIVVGSSARGFDWELNQEVIGKIPQLIKFPLDHLNIRNLTPYDKGWLTEMGHYDPSSKTIYLHPFQDWESTNYTLWHEIQHQYQDQENRMDLTNYVSPADDNYYDEPEQYIEHPIEVDANKFAEVMAQVVLVSAAPAEYNPDWVPNELHLDRGEWDEGSETYQLDPLELRKELWAMVTMFRRDWRQWTTMWDTSHMSKTAASTLYHVAPASDRQNIEQNGLDYSQTNEEGRRITPPGDPAANYMWNDYTRALWYAKVLLEWERDNAFDFQTIDEPDQVDIWRVMLTPDVPIKRDPYFEIPENAQEKKDWTYKGLPPGAVMYQAPISPDHLQLIETLNVKDLVEPDIPFQDITSANEALKMFIIYDFVKDRITLGSKTSDASTKMIGEYNADDNSATIYEAEQQWINPTHFRRLWNYSYPERPLKEVHFQKGDNKRKLRMKEHPYHERVR